MLARTPVVPGACVRVLLFDACFGRYCVCVLRMKPLPVRIIRLPFRKISSRELIIPEIDFIVCSSVHPLPQEGEALARRVLCGRKSPW